MVPSAFLAILYHSQNYVTVPETSQWLSKLAEVEAEPVQIEDSQSEGRQSSAFEFLDIETDHGI